MFSVKEHVYFSRLDKQRTLSLSPSLSLSLSLSLSEKNRTCMGYRSYVYFMLLEYLLAQMQLRELLIISIWIFIDFIQTYDFSINKKI